MQLEDKKTGHCAGFFVPFFPGGFSNQDFFTAHAGPSKTLPSPSDPLFYNLSESVLQTPCP
jgi:hypothetical protein